MRKNKIFPLLLVVTILAVTVLAFRSRTTASTPEDSCKESLDAACHEKKEGGKMIWENLSQQFFSAL